MFILRSKVGNVYRKVATARERDRWVADGYTDVTEELAAEEKAKKAAEDAKKGDKGGRKQGDAK